MSESRETPPSPEVGKLIERVSYGQNRVRYRIEGHDETIAFSTQSDAVKAWELLRRIEKAHAASEADAQALLSQHEQMAQALRELPAKWRDNHPDPFDGGYEFGERTARSECADELEAALAAVLERKDQSKESQTS